MRGTANQHGLERVAVYVAVVGEDTLCGKLLKVTVLIDAVVVIVNGNRNAIDRVDVNANRGRVGVGGAVVGLEGERVRPVVIGIRGVGAGSTRPVAERAVTRFRVADGGAVRSMPCCC